MSITNAINRLKAHQEAEPNETSGSDSPPNHEFVLDRFDDVATGTDLKGNAQLYEISEKFELGQMFKLYFGRIGNILFYLNICVYLYGDLSIYAAGVPKSLRNVVCTSIQNSTSVADADLCWDWSPLTRCHVYRIFVACFALCMLPFLFFHLTRSRWLQIVTTVIRWVSFLLMLCLAIDRAIVIRQKFTLSSITNSLLWNPSVNELVSVDTAPPVVPNPPIVRGKGIPNLFGVCVYVFMCHHSIPGVVTPIQNKRKIMSRVYLPLFASVLAFNLLLSGTAVAAFDDIKDLYTLNFVPDGDSGQIFKIPYILAKIFGYFLSLFPVFALSSTFPILGCTLMGNLNTLFCMFRPFQADKAQKILYWVLPFVVLLPPILIALGTDNIGFLVGFTGAFAGSGIQYIIPALLVYRARQYIAQQLHMNNQVTSYHAESEEIDTDTQPLHSDTADAVGETYIRTPDDFDGCCGKVHNLWHSSSRFHIFSPHASPFKHFFWILLLLIWSILCIVVVLVDKIHPIE